MGDPFFDYFDREIGRPPAGVRERVLSRLGGERPRRRHPWAAWSAATALTALLVTTLMVAGAEARPSRQSGPASPQARSGAAIAYDDRLGELVLFGGMTPDQQVLDDTWTWDGRTWTRRRPPVSPPALAGALTAFDAADGTVVLYGDVGATWTWDGRTWSRHQTAEPGSLPDHSVMAYDPRSRSVVLYVSPWLGIHQTWSWDGRTWAALATSASPDVPSGAMGFSDPWLVLAGLSNQNGTETWVWDGVDWAPRSPSFPLPAGSYSFAYDQARARLVASVQPAGGTVPETWEWLDGSWSEERPAHQPPPGGSMVYDGRVRRVVLYASGGLWTWDGKDWRQKTG